MRRYDVPRLAFINKCDRSGADPIRVLNQMRDKLKLNCSPVQLPLGLEDKLRGLIDVVEQRAYSFGGPFGNEITEVGGPCRPLLLASLTNVLPESVLSAACADHGRHCSLFCERHFLRDDRRWSEAHSSVAASCLRHRGCCLKYLLQPCAWHTFITLLCDQYWAVCGASYYIFRMHRLGR